MLRKFVSRSKTHVFIFFLVFTGVFAILFSIIDLVIIFQGIAVEKP